MCVAVDRPVRDGVRRCPAPPYLDDTYLDDTYLDDTYLDGTYLDGTYLDDNGGMMVSFDRRSLLVGSSAALVAAGLAACAPAVPAPAAPPAPGPGRPQAPGFFRMPVGSFQVTALSDGTFDLDAGALLRGITSPDLAASLAASFLSSPVETSVNAYLVDTGRSRILVDTGCGHLQGPTVGKLAENLRAAGYGPDDVDTVVITHLHTDHIGGLTIDGREAFPNARIRVLAQQQEIDYWLDGRNAATTTPTLRSFFAPVVATLRPYLDQGRVAPLVGDAPIVPGVRPVPLPGHTAGHSGYLVEDGGEQLLIWGDVVHLAEVQFARPEVTIEFDTTPQEAARQRRAVFDDAARRRTLVAGAHLPFPGIGHVRADGGAFAWVPRNYTTR